MSFTPGDPWPQLIVAGPGRVEVNLSHQMRAGRTTLIAFVAPPGAAGFQAVFGQAAQGLSPGITTTIITIGDPPAEETAADSPELVYFGEPIAPRLIGREEGLVLIDRTGRLRAAGALTDLAGLIAAANRLEAAAAQMVAPVLLLEEVLEADLCDRLLAYWAGEPKLENAVAAQNAGNASANTDYKRRADVVLKDKALLGEVSAKISRRVLPEIQKFMRTRIVESEAFRIGCYESENLGGFRRHRDNTTKHTSHRAFAMSMNLNDPAAYEGGQVIFPEFGDRLYQPGRGGCVVFSCALLHEALPVTKGRRFGMFTFMVDEAGLANLKARRKA